MKCPTILINTDSVPNSVEPVLKTADRGEENPEWTLFFGHDDSPYLKSSQIFDLLNTLNDNVAIACPTGRLPYNMSRSLGRDLEREIFRTKKTIEELKIQQGRDISKSGKE